MALEFRPPTDLVNAYLNRPSPGQEASNAILGGFQAYAQQKAAKAQQQQAALKQYIDAFGAGGPKFAGDIAKRVGLDNPPALPSITAAQTPTGGTAGVSYAPGTASMPNGGAPPPAGPQTNYDVNGSTPAEIAAQQSLPSEHPEPVVQASLDAGHPNYSGKNYSNVQLPATEDPTEFLNGGAWGDKQLTAREKLASYADRKAAAQAKAEENGPVVFDYAKNFAKNAGAPEAADGFIELAKSQGRNTLTKREMSDLKDSINVSAQKGRGDYFEGSLGLKQQQMRDSLIKEARTTMDPYFQTGQGKLQAQRLNAIGRAQALAQQVFNQPGGADSRQMTELATSVASVLASGGQNAQAQIEHLIPQTYRGKAAQFVESLTNNPTGTEQQAFIKRYVETLDRESSTIKSQIRSTAERTAPTLRVLKSQFPEDYNAVVDQYMKNSPEIMGQTSDQSTPPPAAASSGGGWSYVGKAQ